MSQSVDDFIIPTNYKKSNFVIPSEYYEKAPVKGEEQKKNYQFRVFPNYCYGTTVHDNGKVEKNIGPLKIFTDDMILGYGGIVTPDGQFRMTNDDCLSMWICTDGEYAGPGGEVISKMINEMDDDIEERIRTNPHFLYPKGQKENPVKDLVFTRNIRPGKGKKDNKEFEWNRIKAVFDYEGETVDSTNEKCKRIGKKDRQFTVTYVDCPSDIVVTTLEELKSHITWGSTIRYMLRFPSFWANKTSKSVGKMQVRECGMKIFCDGVVIISKREGARRLQQKPMNDILAIANKMNKQEQEQQTNKQKQEESDSSDSEVEKNAKKKSAPEKQPAKAVSKPQESDSDSDSSSDSEEERKKKEEEEKKKAAAQKKKPAKK